MKTQILQFTDFSPKHDASKYTVRRYYKEILYKNTYVYKNISGQTIVSHFVNSIFFEADSLVYHLHTVGGKKFLAFYFGQA